MIFFQRTSQIFCQCLSYSIYLQLCNNNTFSIKILSIILFIRMSIFSFGILLYLLAKINCFTVSINKFCTLQIFLFSYLPKSIDILSKLQCISNLSKTHSSILHHKSFTLKHSTNKWSIVSKSIKQKVQAGESISFNLKR